jgi:hypothetical protein
LNKEVDRKIVTYDKTLQDPFDAISAEDTLIIFATILGQV